MEDETQHQQAGELLARYAYIVQTGGDAAIMYPDVAHHLEQCPTCRAILEDMLSASDADIPHNTVTANELLFIRRPNFAKHMARPGSTDTSFSLRIALPLADGLFGESLSAHFASQTVRSLDAMQPSGRLLFYDSVPMGKQQVQIMLTLHRGSTAGQYVIVGELAAEDLPPALKVTIQIGSETYQADVVDGKVVFENVLFDEEVKHIMIILEPPATKPD
jgi:hypothetical protein